MAAFNVHLGGDVSAAGQAPVVHNPSGPGVSSFLDSSFDRNPVPTGTATSILAREEGGTGSTDLDVDVNGTTSETATSVGEGVTTINTAVTDGDYLQILIAGTPSSWDDCNYSVTIEVSQAVLLKCSHGADMDTAGAYARSLGVANLSDVTGTTHVTAFPLIAGTLGRFYYYSDSADGTTDLALDVNGSSAETITNIGAGAQAVTLSGSSVSDGDYLEVEYVSGTAAQGATAHTTVETAGAFTTTQTHAYGGIANGTGNYLSVYGDALDADSPTLDEDKESVSLAGTAKYFVFYSQSGDGTSDWDVILNGSSDEVLTNVGQNGVITLQETAISSGDGLAVQYEAGTAPDSTTVAILVGAEVAGGPHAGSMMLMGAGR